MTNLPERIREVSVQSFGEVAGNLSQPAQFARDFDLAR
jgi:hypothetical protein